MRRRAELVDGTRLRITEAAMRMHTTVGPSATSLSGIAERAGVTRLTLYRHFADADALFAACMGHWRGLHPPPDAGAWRAVPGFEERLRLALGELYTWYDQNAADLYPIYRDAAHTPASNREARRANTERMVDAISDGVTATGVARRRLRAAVRHVVGFWTWRSLSVDGQLSRRQAVDLAGAFVLAARMSD
jgi:AcrR family transcriptional regulator